MERSRQRHRLHRGVAKLWHQFTQCGKYPWSAISEAEIALGGWTSGNAISVEFFYIFLPKRFLLIYIILIYK